MIAIILLSIPVSSEVHDHIIDSNSPHMRMRDLISPFYEG